MKVKVKGYLTYRDSIGEQVLELADESASTLRELLAKLSLSTGLGDALYHSASGDIDRRVVVLVNGHHYAHIPDRVDYLLKDGDEVAIFPPLMGG